MKWRKNDDEALRFLQWILFAAVSYFYIKQEAVNENLRDLAGLFMGWAVRVRRYCS